MIGDERINLCHERARLGQSAHHTAIMLQVVVRQRAAFAVLEPLLANLVAADAELPDDRRDAFEVLPGIDIDAALTSGL